jgi:hypothetical protein
MLPVSDVNAVALPLRRRDEHLDAVEERPPKRGKQKPRSALAECPSDRLPTLS